MVNFNLFYFLDNLLTNQIGLIVVLLLVSLLVLVVFLNVLRVFLRYFYQINYAFDRVVLHILVPKERKSESSQGQQEDRLEQIREEIGLTETIFSMLAGLKPEKGFKSWFLGRGDHISFEIVVHNNLINFYVAVPKSKQVFIEQQISAQYPYAHIEEIVDYNIFSEKSIVLGGFLKNKEKQFFPFKTYKKTDSDPLVSLLNVLSKIHNENSSAAVQFIVRPTNNSWRSQAMNIVREIKQGKKINEVLNKNSFNQTLNKSVELTKEVLRVEKNDEKHGNSHYQLSAMEEEMLKGIEEKISKGGLETTIRIISVSNSKDVAKMNLDNIINSFSQYNLYNYGNLFKAIVPKHPKKIIRGFIYRSFVEKNSIIFNTEELASLWHLPLHSTETPHIKWLTARKTPPPANLPQFGLLLGHIPYRGFDYEVRMKPVDRRRHLYIVGKSGSGKSVFIENLAIQDIKNGHGVCVVDPHGDFAEYVLSHVPKERIEDVIYFNPSDTERPIGLNMLEAKTTDEKDFAVQEMISIFYKLFPPEMIGPMFEHNMRNVMLTLMADINNPGTIIDIPRMFTDDDYVKKYLVKLKDPVVRAFWEKEMKKTSDFHKSEMLGYLISKVGRFVENEMMRNIMGQQQSGFNFREIMDKQKILIVNLAKGKTGEVNSSLLGLIIVSKLQMAAMGRAELPEEERKDFYLYIDEFQNFITDSIATILSEARKYRLNLIIAHQYLGQLINEKGNTSIKNAVLGNAGTIAAFRIGPEDSEILTKEFAPTFGAFDLMNVEKYTCNIKLLVDNEPTKPFNMRTYPPKQGDYKQAELIKKLSRLKYGRDRRVVEHELLERTQLDVASKFSKDDMIESSL